MQSDEWRRSADLIPGNIEREGGVVDKAYLTVNTSLGTYFLQLGLCLPYLPIIVFYI